ncbi:MAG: hypothetical protein WA913_10210 [Pricia sp.]
MRQQLDEQIFESRDIHFLPEYELGNISKKGTPYEYRMDENKYPFKAIYEAASLSGKRGKKIIEQQIELLKNKDSIVRYWAITGLRCQDKTSLKSNKKMLMKAMEDPYPQVSISASAILWQHFKENGAEDTLKQYCLDDNMDLALMAINSLLYIEEKMTFVPTIEKVRQKENLNYNVKAACMDFLGSLGIVENSPDNEQ